MKSNLAMRFVTAGIGIPAIMALLYFGPAWGWLIFMCAAIAVGSIELFGMTHRDRASQAIGTALSVGFCLSLWFASAHPHVLILAVFAIPLASQALVLWRLGDIQSAALRVSTGVFGPIYLGGGLGALALLRRDGGDDGPGFVVLALLLSWLADTGGYFAGRFLGKRKLYEAVSPKKTVAGAFGGLAGGILGSVLAHFVFVTSLPLVHALLLGLVGTALGMLGDLGESLLKRSVGVKDSGGIVPGHGGILDRVDALLVTGSICYAYVALVR